MRREEDKEKGERHGEKKEARRGKREANRGNRGENKRKETKADAPTPSYSHYTYHLR